MGESLLEKPLVKHCRTKWHNYVNIRGLRHYKRDNRISTVRLGCFLTRYSRRYVSLVSVAGVHGRGYSFLHC
jgi:hypothetical protein